MAPVLFLILVLLGLLGPVTSLQWREGRWIGAARWIGRRLSPQFIAGVPMAGVLLMTIGLSVLWPPGIILVFIAAAGFLWALFAAAPSSDQPPATRERADGIGARARAPRRPRTERPPRTRTAGESPRAAARPRPRSP
jgi:hypothetical protein